jgi:hypothetical protein
VTRLFALSVRLQGLLVFGHGTRRPRPARAREFLARARGRAPFSSSSH